MRLPKQVQDAADRADKVIEGIKKARAGEGSPDAAPPEAAQVQDAPTTPPTSDTSQQTATAPSAESTEAPKDRADWKAKYHTLQGMFNAEVPRLNAEVKRLSLALTAANSKIAELETAATRVTAAPAKDGHPTQHAEVQKALSEVVGDEVAKLLIEQIGSNAKAIEDLKAEIGKKLEPVQKGVEQVQQDRAQDAQSKFTTLLSELVPDWAEIDGREDWSAFLAAEDNFGSVRQELLNNAAKKFNVAAVAAIFNEFKKLVGIPTSAVTNRPDTGRSALEKQQVPAPSVQTVTPSTPAVKRWTKDEVAKFTKEAISGRVPQDVIDRTFMEIRAAGLS